MQNKNLAFAHFILNQHKTESLPSGSLPDDNSLCYDKLASRERILLAALKLFVEQGYFNTNIPDLSKESRCSVGSIYHHFKNKEEVATALYEAGLSCFRLALEQEINAITDIELIIKSIVISFLKFSQEHKQLSKYMWLSRHVEFMSGSIKHPTMVGFDRLGRHLTKIIKQGIRRKKIRPLRANVIWSIIFGIPLSYVRDWHDGYNKIPPSEFAAELAEACWRAIEV